MNQPLNTELYLQLKDLQKEWLNVVRFKNRKLNHLENLAARECGFHTGMSDNERKKCYALGRELIKEVVSSENSADVTNSLHSDYRFGVIFHSTYLSIETDRKHIHHLEKKIVSLASLLPVARWMNQENQRGFGFKSLGQIIGITGDLANYANPAKVWKMLSLHPIAFDGKVLMGSTWRFGKEGKLPKEIWTDAGYSPSRRSLMYVIGESLMKGNRGEYRTRYDEAKSKAELSHPEWCECSCNGDGKNGKGKKCSRCGGKGKVLMRVHRHAMLLMTKRLIRNLWIEWNQSRANEPM